MSSRSSVANRHSRTTDGQRHRISSMKYDTRCVFLPVRTCRAHGRQPTPTNILNKVRTQEMVRNGTRRLTRNRACSSVYAVPEGPQARHLWGSASPNGEFLRVAQELQRSLSSSFFGSSMPATSSRSRAMLFGQHLALDLPKPIAHLCAALHAVHEIDPYTNQQRIGSSDKSRMLETGLCWGSARTECPWTSAGW